MQGEMSGWFEVRADGPKPGGGKGRHHYRFFCLLDYDAQSAGTGQAGALRAMSGGTELGRP
jgi:hypothetical protein